MTKSSILVVLATLYCSAAITAVVSASQDTPASPADTPFGPDASLAPRVAPQIPTAMTAATPSGAPILSPGWNLARPNPDGFFATQLVYPIPNTSKIISFTSINSPLPAATVLMCFLQASNDILDQTIAMRRDGFIKDGRFTSHFTNGTTSSVMINVQDQVSTGQKVTYGTLAIALRGLGQFMTAQNSFFEANFNIYDPPWGQVGHGSIVGSQFRAVS